MAENSLLKTIKEINVDLTDSDCERIATVVSNAVKDPAILELLTERAQPKGDTKKELLYDAITGKLVGCFPDDKIERPILRASALSLVTLESLGDLKKYHNEASKVNSLPAEKPLDIEESGLGHFSPLPMADASKKATTPSQSPPPRR